MARNPHLTTMVIYFDLDGPILDVSERYFRVHRAIVGSGVLGRAEFWNLKRQRAPLDQILAKDKASIDTQTYRTAWLSLIEEQEYLKHDRVVAGARAVLALLGLSHRLVLVTLRRNRENLLWQLKDLDLASSFARILSGNAREELDWQTKARLIRADLEEEGEGPAVIVGDTEVDLLAGQVLGLATIAVCSGIRAPQFLGTIHPDWLLDDIATVPQAVGVLSLGVREALRRSTREGLAI